MALLQAVFKRKNYRISFFLAVVMILWLVSGLWLRSDIAYGQTGSEGDSSDQESGLQSVKARVIQAQDIPLSVSVLARTEPFRSVDVKAEIGGTVAELPVEKGEYVESGDLLCQLESEDRPEILQQAKAALEKAEIDYEGALRLRSGGFQSQSEIAQAQANLDSARAAHRRAELDLDNLQIRAPFEGFVDARPVEVGDLMQRGEICARVLDLDPLLIVGQIAETAIPYISPGVQVEAQLVTGEQVTGTVRFVERSADEITRTFRIEAIVPNPELDLHTGLSARMSIPTDEVKAQLVNSSLFILADSGEIGLKTLDDENRVQFTVVDLIADHGSGVWVSGLPETATLITLGQQYVAEGEEVLVTLEEDSASASSGN